MADEQDAYPTYAAFWPYYLSQHSRRETQLVHFLGTVLALWSVANAFILFDPLWFLWAPIIGYGVAWFGHAYIEKNHPATFTYPVWSLRADFHMLGLWLTGQLPNELKKYNIVS